MKYVVAVIGVGALGKRHLSSILESRLELEVYCYDVNARALDEFEWEDSFQNKFLTMVSSIDDIPAIVDFAVISTTSDVRRMSFEELIKGRTVKNIVFEKVLFQKVEDYEYVLERIEELGIKAWVNCAKRQMDSYQNLKRELERAREMHIYRSGGEWGLACNIIHEIDLIEFLSESQSMQIESVNLLPIIGESRRQGFKEVYGTIKGNCGKVKDFTINCMYGITVPDILFISSDIGQYIVNEYEEKLVAIRKENDNKSCEEEFKIPYQSQMTQSVMEDILLSGKTRLTPFTVSVRQHLRFIKQFITFFENNGMEAGKCPIT